MEKFTVKTPGLVYLEANKSFSGDHGGMWYCVRYGDGKLTAYVWPMPWCFEKTDDSLKLSAEFDFDEAGLAASEEWIAAQYEADPHKWAENPFLPLGEPVESIDLPAQPLPEGTDDAPFDL